MPFKLSLVQIQSKPKLSFQFKLVFKRDLKIKLKKIKHRSFVAGLGTSNTIRAYKIGKKDDSSIQITQAAVQDFPQVNC